MTSGFWWTFIQIGALIAIPIAVLRGVQLWLLLGTGRFMYKPLRGESVTSTRTERPRWYWWLVVSKAVSLAVSLALVGFVGFWTLHPR